MELLFLFEFRAEEWLVLETALSGIAELDIHFQRRLSHSDHASTLDVLIGLFLSFQA